METYFIRILAVYIYTSLNKAAFHITLCHREPTHIPATLELFFLKSVLGYRGLHPDKAMSIIGPRSRPLSTGAIDVCLLIAYYL